MEKHLTETILNHASCRRYQEQAIPEDLVQELFAAAQMAPSSLFMQAYSILRVDDPDLRQVLYEASGKQENLLRAPLVLLYCADLYRTKEHMPDMDSNILKNTELYTVAVTDTALAAQNLLLAAEAHGLGLCYVGGIRSGVDRIIEAFNLPEWVFPLYCQTIGWPAEKNAKKPRLLKEIVIHENTYNKEKYPELIGAYDQQMEAYYKERGKTTNWSRFVAGKVQHNPRFNVDEAARKQGFLKH